MASLFIYYMPLWNYIYDLHFCYRKEVALVSGGLSEEL